MSYQVSLAVLWLARLESKQFNLLLISNSLNDVCVDDIDLLLGQVNHHDREFCGIIRGEYGQCGHAAW